MKSSLGGYGVDVGVCSNRSFESHVDEGKNGIRQHNFCHPFIPITENFVLKRRWNVISNNVARRLCWIEKYEKKSGDSSPVFFSRLPLDLLFRLERRKYLISLLPSKCYRSYGVLLWEIFSLGYMPYPGRVSCWIFHHYLSCLFVCVRMYGSHPFIPHLQIF